MLLAFSLASECGLPASERTRGARIWGMARLWCCGKSVKSCDCLRAATSRWQRIACRARVEQKRRTRQKTKASCATALCPWQSLRARFASLTSASGSCRGARLRTFARRCGAKYERRLSILQEVHPKGEPTRLEPGIPYHIWRVSALLSCEVTRRRSDVATPFVFMCGPAFLPVEREAVA